MTNGNSNPGTYDVAIVGGGISGCAAAYYLTKRGVKPLVLERHDLNTEASGRNAGSLHGQIQHEPFLEEGDEWAQQWLPSLKFLADSLEIWDGLSEELGIDLQVAKRGGLLVADHPDQMPAIERKVAFERSIGIDSRVLTGDELREIAPYISDDAVGGELCPIEGKANPLIAAPSFAQRAAENGAEFRVNTRVDGFTREGDAYVIHTSAGDYRARQIVLAGGDGMPELGKHFGVDLPINSGAVQVSLTERIEPLVKHLVYYAGGKLTFKQAQAGTLLIGGGWPARQNAEGEWVLNPESLRTNLGIATRVAPVVSDVKLLRTWVGIGNGTPDHGPIIGEIPEHPGVFVGFYPYMGFTAGPLMGQVLTSLVMHEEPQVDLTPFDMNRF